MRCRRLLADAFCVFKPSHVPLFSPLQAMHDTFDTQRDKAPSVANHVLLQLAAAAAASSVGATATGGGDQEEEEEIVRVDRLPRGRATASSPAGRRSVAVPSVVSPALLAPAATAAGGAFATPPATASAGRRRVREVRFPLGADWFASGVVLAATSPAAFTFLLHAASIGAVRREYHAQCRLPADVAERGRRAAGRRAAQLDVTTALFGRNEHMIRHVQRQQSGAAGSGAAAAAAARRDGRGAGGAVASRGIVTSGVVVAATGAVAESGWIRGGVASLADLAASHEYRPEIDQLFMSAAATARALESSSNDAAAPLAADAINNNNSSTDALQQLPPVHWTARRAHPFLRKADVLAPAGPALLESLARAAHVDVQFVVESVHGDVAHLRLSVAGLQTDAAVRCALAAAGMPVVNDFEYDPVAAARIAAAAAAATSAQSSGPRNGGSSTARRGFAVDANRILTPAEVFAFECMMRDAAASAPRLVCTRVTFPDPAVDRNVGILRHIVGAARTTRELVHAATKRVPTSDTTPLFACCSAEVPPPAYFAADAAAVASVNGGLPSSAQVAAVTTAPPSAVRVLAVAAAAAAASSANAAAGSDECAYEAPADAVVASGAQAAGAAAVTGVVPATSSGGGGGGAASLEADARLVILAKVREEAEAQEATILTQRGVGFSPGHRQQRSSAPGLHAAPASSSPSSYHQRQEQRRAPRCKFCFGPHPVAACPKLAARERPNVASRTNTRADRSSGAASW